MRRIKSDMGFELVCENHDCVKLSRFSFCRSCGSLNRCSKLSIARNFKSELVAEEKINVPMCLTAAFILAPPIELRAVLPMGDEPMRPRVSMAVGDKAGSG